MIDVIAWLNSALSADSALLALVGDANRIYFGYANTFEVLPIVTFKELNQSHARGADDAPIVYDSYVEIHVWTDDNGTTAIAIAVDAIMISMLWHCEYSSDTPEPNTKMRHRVMRYRRQLTAEDLT